MCTKHSYKDIYYIRLGKRKFYLYMAVLEQRKNRPLPNYWVIFKEKKKGLLKRFIVEVPILFLSKILSRFQH